jgi:transcription initiation factor IIE alpha subunit
MTQEVVEPLFAELAFDLLSDHRIGPASIRVMVALQRWRNNECLASDEEIAVAAAISARSVQRALTQLLTLGLIRKTKYKSRRRLILDWMLEIPRRGNASNEWWS